MKVETESFPVCPRPDYTALRECAQQYPGVDLGAVETNLEFARVSSQMVADFDAFCAGFKVSRGRFMVLVSLLQNEKGLSPGELADLLQVTRATMTGLIDTLEQSKFIERLDDPADRRMYRVVITQQGRDFLDRILPMNFQRAGVIHSHLSAQERAELIRLLRKVEAGLDDFRTQRGRTASEA